MVWFVIILFIQLHDASSPLTPTPAWFKKKTKLTYLHPGCGNIFLLQASYKDTNLNDPFLSLCRCHQPAEVIISHEREYYLAYPKQAGCYSCSAQPTRHVSDSMHELWLHTMYSRSQLWWLVCVLLVCHLRSILLVPRKCEFLFTFLWSSLVWLSTHVADQDAVLFKTKVTWCCHEWTDLDTWASKSCLL